MKNKKGAEMTIGTIIIIILALVVLVVLIYGFSTGWSNLWEKINVFGGGKTNVQTIVQACQLACTTNSQYDYCTKTSKVTFTIDKKDTVGIARNGKYNCKGLETLGGFGCDVDFGTCEEISPTAKNAEQIAAENKAKCEAITTNDADCFADGCTWNDNTVPKCKA